MKVLSRCLLLTVFAVVIIFSSISFAEEPGKVKVENGTIISAQEVKDKAGWALGTWKGFMGGQTGNWTLEVKEIDKTAVTDGKESVGLKGSFRYKEDKPSNVVVRLTGGKMTFKAWGKEDYILDRATETRIEGIQKRTDGKEYQIRFWKLSKEGFGTDTARNSPFFGVWEGSWNPSPKGKYIIEFVDNAAATILYEWDGSSWEWQNVSISPNGEFRVGPDTRYMAYKLSGNKKSLEGELFTSGEKTSSISAEKKIQDSEKLLKPRTVFSASVTSNQSASPELRWAIGKWRGFQHSSKSTWALEIAEKDGKLNGSFMFVTDTSKMYATPINIGAKTLVFQNAAKEEFVLNRSSDNRLDGIYTDTNRLERVVRFWKEGEANTNPLLGTWEGIWDIGQKARFTVEQIDSTTATVRYDVGPAGNDSKGGWNRYNASVVGKGELRVEYRDILITLDLSKDQKTLKAEYLRSGNTTGKTNLSKIDLNAQLSANEQSLSKEISAFLGTWDGPRTDGTQVHLTVEKINLKEAEILYRWDDSPWWGKGGQTRRTAEVDVKETTIKWGGREEYIFTMKKDLNSIDFYIKNGINQSLFTTMKRSK
jgi:hypothetical protein